MAATMQQRENVVRLAEVRAYHEPAAPVSLEMNWEAIHAEEDESGSLGKTIWFAVAISTALWAVIAGAIWLV